MAFLDNSGDIILDAVLTDTGRMRLARGDGSFRIAKFALGDDEINYGSYNKTHASGSAYYDLSILQTPVLEAFTNNTSMMKSKLLSIAQQDLLYLPVIRLNWNWATTRSQTVNPLTSNVDGGDGSYLLTADSATADQTAAGNVTLKLKIGVKAGNSANRAGQTPLVFDQGIEIAAGTHIPSNPLDMGNPLRETQYIVEVDDRFIKIANPITDALAPVSFVDDDRIASYFLSEVADEDYITAIGQEGAPDNIANDDSSPILGSAGSRLKVKLFVSSEIENSTYYFEKFGSTGYNPYTTGTHRYIDTTVRITGFTTGNRTDLPVRIIKKNY